MANHHNGLIQREAQSSTPHVWKSPGHSGCCRRSPRIESQALCRGPCLQHAEMVLYSGKAGKKRSRRAADACRCVNSDHVGQDSMACEQITCAEAESSRDTLPQPTRGCRRARSDLARHRSSTWWCWTQCKQSLRSRWLCCWSEMPARSK